MIGIIIALGALMGGTVIEGGSPARDRIEWMTTYNKPPLRSWLESPWVTERFSWLTFEPFPSLTLMRRRP